MANTNKIKRNIIVNKILFKLELNTFLLVFSIRRLLWIDGSTLIQTGHICDAKTIMAVQYWELQKN